MLRRAIHYRPGDTSLTCLCPGHVAQPLPPSIQLPVCLWESFPQPRSAPPSPGPHGASLGLPQSERS